ncbi:MAG: DUF1697 domain-containing protein [Acidimicrobiia bacterium]
MATFIALLRAVNVGTGRNVKMTDLARVVAEAGGDRISTYIQSGNVVFAHPERSTSQLEAQLERGIAAMAGFDVDVVVRTMKEWEAVVSGCPYEVEDPTKLFVAFLKTAPPSAVLEAFDPSPFAPETFTSRGRELYLHLPNGMGRAKLPLAVGKLKLPPTTTRNWRTILELQKYAERCSA